jgi:hypothetical protein
MCAHTDSYAECNTDADRDANSDTNTYRYA